MKDDLIKNSKLHQDIKKDGIGVTRVSIKSKVTNGFKSFCRDIIALWRLIVTVSEAMGAYILIPQSALGDKVIGGVLLISAVTMAVKQYTNHD